MDHWQVPEKMIKDTWENNTNFLIFVILLYTVFASPILSSVSKHLQSPWQSVFQAATKGKTSLPSSFLAGLFKCCLSTACVFPPRIKYV